MAKQMIIGPIRMKWKGEQPKGDCPDCGGQCAPVCGQHPAGCTYGGLTKKTGYWMIAKGCKLYHGEKA